MGSPNPLSCVCTGGATHALCQPAGEGQPLSRGGEDHNARSLRRVRTPSLTFCAGGPAHEAGDSGLRVLLPQVPRRPG